MGSLETFSIIVHGWGCDCHPAGRARDAAKHPTMLRTAAPTNNCPAPVSTVPKLSNPVFHYELHEDSDFLFTALSRCLEHRLARSSSSMECLTERTWRRLFSGTPRSTCPAVTARPLVSRHCLFLCHNQKTRSHFQPSLPCFPSGVHRGSPSLLTGSHLPQPTSILPTRSLRRQ